MVLSGQNSTTQNRTENSVVSSGSCHLTPKMATSLEQECAVADLLCGVA